MLFPIGTNQSYAETNFVTVSGSAMAVDPLNVPNLTIETLIEHSDVLTIPFSDLVTVPGNTFDELDITFSLAADTGSFFESFTSFTGTNPTSPSSATDVLTVTENSVVINTTFLTGHNTDLNFDYTVTDKDGRSGSGVITITFGNIVGDVTANPYTVTLLDLFELPTFDIAIPLSVITQTFLAGTQVGVFGDFSITLTTTGTGDQSGTLTITSGTISTGDIFSYTPVPGFAGTETFPYTATIGGKSGSSELIFVVPAPICTSSLDAGIDFGELDAGETSGESELSIANTGNTNIQVMMSGEKWISAGDPDIDTMNEGVTKYSLTDTETYAQKTALTSIRTNVGDEQGEGSLSVYMQLLIDLLDVSFRGATTQELTVTSTCS